MSIRLGNLITQCLRRWPKQTVTLADLWYTIFCPNFSDRDLLIFTLFICITCPECVPSWLPRISLLGELASGKRQKTMIKVILDTGQHRLWDPANSIIRGVTRLSAINKIICVVLSGGLESSQTDYYPRIFRSRWGIHSHLRHLHQKWERK